MEPSKIGVVIVLCAFMTFPLIAKRLNPTNQHLNIAEPTAAFPSPISLWKQINVKGIEITSNGPKTVDVNIPSPYCLHKHVKVFKGKKGNCESMLWDTLSPVWRILEFTDTRTLLAHHESIVNCPTWGSFLIKVMERAITNSHMDANNLQLIMRYKAALSFVMTTIFLPLIANRKEFHQQTLWLHCKPSGARCNMKTSLSKKMIKRQANNKTNSTVFPIVNPAQWLLPADNQPITTLFNAPIYLELKEKLSYHDELFNKGHFIDYLDSFAKDAKLYPNSGFLFMRILVKLEEKLRFASNTELWKAVVNYKRAIQTTALSHRVPMEFLKSLETTEVDPAPTINIYESLDTTEVVPAPTTNVYENAPVFPKWLNPMKGMVVHPLDWPAPSYIKLNTGDNPSINGVSLPSIYCLQSPSDFAKLSENCKEAAEDWRTLMANAFPVGYKTFASNNDMKKLYPTLISYFAGFDKSVKSSTIESNGHQLSTYRSVLALTIPYINLPLIAHFYKLNTEVVWLTFDPDDSLNPIMSPDRPQKIDKKKIILPLVNPRLWHLPVDKKNPYSVLIPNLHADDPYAIKIKPLINILQPGTGFTDTFESIWKPLDHETRGLLFMNVLLRLDSENAFGVKDDRILKYVAVIAKNYRAAIQSLAFFKHVPLNYIKDEVF